MGERVNVGEAEVEGDLGVVPLLKGDWEVESASNGRAEFEKTVRSFWRERAGERRREGMAVVAWCGVEMVLIGVHGDDLGDESLYPFWAGFSALCSRKSYIRLVSRKLVVMIWSSLVSCAWWQR